MPSNIECSVDSASHATDILVHRLHLRDGTMLSAARSMLELEGVGPSIYSAVYRVDGVPMGIALIQLATDTLPGTPFKHTVSVYVKPSHRRIGVGAVLVERLLKFSGLTKDTVYARAGIKNSEKFWSKVKIFCLGNKNFVCTYEESQAIRESPPEKSTIIVAKAVMKNLQTQMEQQGFNHLIVR